MLQTGRDSQQVDLLQNDHVKMKSLVTSLPSSKWNNPVLLCSCIMVGTKLSGFVLKTAFISKKVCDWPFMSFQFQWSDKPGISIMWNWPLKLFSTTSNNCNRTFHEVPDVLKISNENPSKPTDTDHALAWYRPETTIVPAAIAHLTSCTRSWYLKSTDAGKGSRGNGLYTQRYINTCMPNRSLSLTHAFEEADST
jgi:hypothetical protein